MYDRWSLLFHYLSLSNSLMESGSHTYRSSKSQAASCSCAISWVYSQGYCRRNEVLRLLFSSFNNVYYIVRRLMFSTTSKNLGGDEFGKATLFDEWQKIQRAYAIKILLARCKCCCKYWWFQGHKHCTPKNFWSPHLSFPHVETKIAFTSLFSSRAKRVSHQFFA